METSKKNQTPLIIAVVAVVLCCCCVILAIAGYYGFINRSTETPIQPLEAATPDIQAPSTEVEPGNDFDTPDTDLEIGAAPTGGLGNDTLRTDTWQYVAAAAHGLGCDQPLGADTQIEVLQEPQNGVWAEKWTVACASGDRYPFEVEFILDDTGATFNIKSIP